MATIGMADLPPEILSQVFDHLATPAPSETRLHEMPGGDMLDGDTLDLKAVSRVCKGWRFIALPLLFRNVLWRPRLSSLNVDGLQPLPLLRFLLHHRLRHHVVTLTLVVDFAEHEVDAALIAYQLRPSDLEWLWDQLFSVLDPLRFTIIAPPASLAAFLNRMLFLDDAWSFDIPYHILSLARPYRDPAAWKSPVDSPSLLGPRPAPIPSAPSPRGSDSRHGAVPAPPCPFLTHKPWTSLLLNEGSSIRAYQTYEFFLRMPPSMLSALLGTGEYPNNVPLLPPTITDFNYIAVFPLSSHVHNLFLQLPKLERLFVQFTPRPGNRVLEDRHLMKKIDMADLWMERNTAYATLLAHLVNAPQQSNWSTLKVLESGDAADKESWDMAMAYLERELATDWRPERDGLLVRLGEDGHPVLPTEVVEQHLRKDGFATAPRRSVCPNYPYNHLS